MAQTGHNPEETVTLPIQNTEPPRCTGAWSNVPGYQPQEIDGQEDWSLSAPVPLQAQEQGFGQQNGRVTSRHGTADVRFDYAIFYPNVLESEYEVRYFVKLLEKCCRKFKLEKLRIWASFSDPESLGRRIPEEIEYGLTHSTHYLLYIDAKYYSDDWYDYTKQLCVDRSLRGEARERGTRVIPVYAEKTTKRNTENAERRGTARNFLINILKSIKLFEITNGRSIEAIAKNIEIIENKVLLSDMIHSLHDTARKNRVQEMNAITDGDDTNASDLVPDGGAAESASHHETNPKVPCFTTETGANMVFVDAFDCGMSAVLGTLFVVLLLSSAAVPWISLPAALALGYFIGKMSNK